MTLTIHAPLAGLLQPLEVVDDPVFAHEIVGPGAALAPASLERQQVLSPIDGTVAKMMGHAFVVVSRSGVPVLVHMGINTINLAGEGFEPIRREGDQVRAGDPLTYWNPQVAVDAGLAPTVPVIILDSKTRRVDVTGDYDSEVTPVDAILAVSDN
ncbi:PTS glucose transporter subunit IIA [Schaalia sp. Marseille-Q2122]|uniref:PTS sugar transporter subunit IIA n=1 Tax=Schaalia sp. Marseille-Q2122 TaxID=2736604 RepID=UPI0015885803|nr:PTS glucose transporter subunit IIA [Schaalia sp. Marseille-Q2122]